MYSFLLKENVLTIIFRQFVTCGADGDIRIWSVNETIDPVHNCVGEWALAIRQKDDKLYVATGSNNIQILSLPEGERNGVLDRFVAPINHIAVSKKEKVRLDSTLTLK